VPVYRVYYNRSLDWPQCWSIDEGDQSSEINVIGFELNGATAISAGLTPEEKQQINPRDTPAAWLRVHCSQMDIRNGIARFY